MLIQWTLYSMSWYSFIYLTKLCPIDQGWHHNWEGACCKIACPKNNIQNTPLKGSQNSFFWGVICLIEPVFSQIAIALLFCNRPFSIFLQCHALPIHFHFGGYIMSKSERFCWRWICRMAHAGIFLKKPDLLHTAINGMQHSLTSTANGCDHRLMPASKLWYLKVR